MVLRGTVYMADIGFGLKPWLIVSNNARNGAMNHYLAVRITSTPKPNLASIVQLGPQDPFGGSILCDEITFLQADELGEYRGGLTPQTLVEVGRALAVALAIN